MQASAVTAPLLGAGWAWSRLPLAIASALCTAVVVLAALAFSGRSAQPGEDLATPKAGPFWRMPRAHVQRAAKAGTVGSVQHLLAAHPDFVREFDALAKRSSAQSLLEALRAGAVHHGRVHHLKMSEAEKDAELLQRRRKLKVRELVNTRHQMLARQILAEEEADNATRSGPFPPEHGAFNDWVLTLKPAAINMSNVSWGAWRTPDNSNAYSGMTAPVPNMSITRLHALPQEKKQKT